MCGQWDCQCRLQSFNVPPLPGALASWPPPKTDKSQSGLWSDRTRNRKEMVIPRSMSCDMRIPFFIHGGQLARSRIAEPGPRICSWLWRSWHRKTKNQDLRMSRNGIQEIQEIQDQARYRKEGGPFWRVEEQLAAYRFVRTSN